MTSIDLKATKMFVKLLVLYYSAVDIHRGLILETSRNLLRSFPGNVWSSNYVMQSAVMNLVVYDTGFRTIYFNILCIFFFVFCFTVTCSRWFLARGFFYNEDGGDTFLRNFGSHKIYTAPHPRRRHSS
jgi:hypothetical protein